MNRLHSRRSQHLRAWARQEGFRFLPQRIRGYDEEYGEFECLQEGIVRYASGVFEGWHGDVEVRGFDWHYQQSILDAMDGMHRATHTWSVLIARAPLELDPIRILPHDRSGTFDLRGAWKAFDDPDPRVGERYVVECMDEDNARDFLDERVIRALIRAPSYFCVEGNRSGIGIFCPGNLFSFEDYRAANVLALVLVDAARAMERVRMPGGGGDKKGDAVTGISRNSRAGDDAPVFHGRIVQPGLPNPRIGSEPGDKGFDQLCGEAGGSVLRGFGVEGIAETVAEEIEGEKGGREEEGGEDEEGRIADHAVGALLDEAAPGSVWGLDAEAEEGEDGFEAHDGGDGEGGVDDDRADGIGDEVAEDDSDVRESETARGFDELLIFEGEDLTADNASHGEPFDGADADEEEPELVAEVGGEDDDNDEEGKGV